MMIGIAVLLAYARYIKIKTQREKEMEEWQVSSSYNIEISSNKGFGFAATLDGTVNPLVVRPIP